MQRPFIVFINQRLIQLIKEGVKNLTVADIFVKGGGV